MKEVEENGVQCFQVPLALDLKYFQPSPFCSYQIISRERQEKLTCWEVFIIVNNRVQKVGLPGMLCLSHSSVVVEDILVSPREIPPILHDDDKQPVGSLSPCLHFQLSQDSNWVFFQVFKCCGIPTNCNHNHQTLAPEKSQHPLS